MCSKHNSCYGQQLNRNAVITQFLKYFKEIILDKVFVQKQGANLRKYTLTEDKILVETRSLRKNEKYEVMLDNVGLDKLYKSDSTIPGKIFFFICLAIPIVLTIAKLLGANVDNNSIIINYVIWFALALVGYFKKSQDDIYLTGGQIALVFYRTIPSEKEVLEFIDKIIVASKKFVKEKYAKVNIDIPQEIFFGRLNFLLEKNVITESEYYEIKKEYELKKLI